MRIEVIPQIELGEIHRMRTGDLLNKTVSDPSYNKFRFAVAYMRTSGWDRLAGSIDALINRGGSVSGAVGIDDAITTIEALESLGQVSRDSTVFHTVSGFIYHPKLYLMGGETSAVAVVGSSNLTRDGLFRNIELSTAIHLDFESSLDLGVYRRYDLFLNELLNVEHPNVQPVTDETLRKLSAAGLIKHENQAKEPDSAVRSRYRRSPDTIEAEIESIFPSLKVPVAPPTKKLTLRQPSVQPSIVIPPATIGIANAFVMQLSSFDSSHRTGVPGTPEVLIPHAAINFFPSLSISGRKYPDAIFDVVLNTLIGRERRSYRLWYYEQRATGTRIDEYRLRMNHETIDLSVSRGGDLLVINKLPAGSEPAYEVTILPQTDPTFPAFLTLCNREAQGKKWGIV